MTDYTESLLSEEKDMLTVEERSIRLSVETSFNFAFLNTAQKLRMVCSSWVIDTPLYFIAALMQFLLGVQLLGYLDEMSWGSNHSANTWNTIAGGLIAIGGLGMFFTALTVLRYANECWILIITEGCLRSIRQFLIRRTMLNRRSRVDKTFLLVAVILDCCCWMLIALTIYGAMINDVKNVYKSAIMAALFTCIHVAYCTFKYVYRRLTEAWRISHVFKWPLRHWLFPCCECSLVCTPVILFFFLTIYILFIRREPITIMPTAAPT